MYDNLMKSSIHNKTHWVVATEAANKAAPGKKFQSIRTYIIVFNRYFDARAVTLSMSVLKKYYECLHSRKSNVC